MNLKDKNILIIGDNHITTKINFTQLGVSHKPAKFNSVTEPFANFQDSVRLANVHLDNSTKLDLLMLFPFLWELVYMKRCDKNNGILQLKEYMDYSLKGLLLQVKSVTTKWLIKYPRLKVCWCLPYTPDFARYNEAPISYSNKEFDENQRQAKELHSRIKKFLEAWSVEIPEILLFDLNECYFLNEHFMEQSFLQTNFSQPHFPTMCTIDGLVPSYDFITRFLEVFEEKIYPYLNTNTAQNIRQPITSEAMAITPSAYSTNETRTYQGRHNSQHSLVIDYQHSKPPPNTAMSHPMYNNPSSHQPHQPQPISPVNEESNLHDNYYDEYGQKQSSSYQRNYYEPSHHDSRQQPYYDNSYFEDSNERKFPDNTENHSNQNEVGRLGTGIYEFLSTTDTEIKPILPVPGLNLPDISDGLLSSVKDALKFLTTNQSQTVEREPSPYAKPLDTIFDPKTWTDLFLNGDLNIALDCLDSCAKRITNLESKKGLKIIMVTSSQEFIDAAEKSLSNLVEQNKLGINDNIPFGAPVFLVDLPCNLRMRLSQPKFENLSQLAALLVFGDSLLSLKTTSNIEFVHLIKCILSKARTENLCKIVVSESGSTEAEVVAQNALKTTFYAPKKEIPLNKQNEGNIKEKQSLNDFLISETLKEESKASSAAILASKSTLKEKSRSPSRKRKKKSHNQQEGEETSSPTSADKLESIFKLAHITISEEELKAYEEHDKIFMSFLEPLGHAAEKEYMTVGRDALQAHEADYKSYKEVPDLHPLFEEKYELFVKRFEDVYGKDYNNRHLQKTWKHFWEITSNSIQDKEWREKKKKFQQDFKNKYFVKAAEIAAKEKARAKSHHKSGKVPLDSSSNSKSMEKPNHANEDDIIFIKKNASVGSMLERQRLIEREKKERKETENDKGKRKETENDKGKRKETENDKGKRKETENDKGKRKEKENDKGKRKEKDKGKRKEYEGDKIEEQSKRIKMRGSQDKSEEDSIYQTLSVDEEFKKIYLESCSKVAQKSKTLLDDSDAPRQGKATKPDPVQPREEKPKIVFNLGRPKSKEEKPTFSLEVALHYLETISSKIGVMGPALLSIVETAKEKLKKSPCKAYEIFAENESELLVNIAISKLKTLIGSSPWSEAEVYRSALPLFQKLLSEAKKRVEKPSSQKEKSTTGDQTGGQQHRLDLQAIARATVGFDAESTFSFIKNTFLYKGLDEPSKEDLHQVFKDVSALHFRLAMS